VSETGVARDCYGTRDSRPSRGERHRRTTDVVVIPFTYSVERFNPIGGLSHPAFVATNRRRSGRTPESNEKAGAYLWCGLQRDQQARACRQLQDRRAAYSSRDRETITRTVLDRVLLRTQMSPEELAALLGMSWLDFSRPPFTPRLSIRTPRGHPRSASATRANNGKNSSGSLLLPANGGVKLANRHEMGGLVCRGHLMSISGRPLACRRGKHLSRAEVS
jgi:hypothetical protein